MQVGTAFQVLLCLRLRFSIPGHSAGLKGENWTTVSTTRQDYLPTEIPSYLSWVGIVGTAIPTGEILLNTILNQMRGLGWVSWSRAGLTRWLSRFPGRGVTMGYESREKKITSVSTRKSIHECHDKMFNQKYQFYIITIVLAS